MHLAAIFPNEQQFNDRQKIDNIFLECKARRVDGGDDAKELVASETFLTVCKEALKDSVTNMVIFLGYRGVILECRKALLAFLLTYLQKCYLICAVPETNK